MRSDFSRRHPWLVGMLAGLGLALVLVVSDLVAGDAWDAVAFGAGLGLVAGVVLGLFVWLAARPRRRD